MNIAELFVRVSADVTGLERGMTTAQRSTQRTGDAMQAMSRRVTSTSAAGTLNVNRLSGAFMSLASQVTGVNPAVARLGGVLGTFAVGGTVVAGALLGIYAISAGWQLWNKDAREAREEIEKLTGAIIAAADARSLGKTGAAESVREAALAGMRGLRTEAGVLRGAVLPMGVGDEGAQAASLMAQRRLKQIDVLIGEHARAYIEAGTQISEVRAAEAVEIGKAGEALAKLAEERRKATQQLLDQRLRWAGEQANIGKITPMGREGLAGESTVFDKWGQAVRDPNALGGMVKFPDSEQMTRMVSGMTKYRAAAEGASLATAALADHVLGFADRSGDAITAWATGAGLSFREFIDGAIADLTRLIVKMAIFEGLRAIFGGMTGGVGGFIAGQLGPSIFAPSGSAMSSSAIMDMLPLGPPMTPREAARDGWHREFIQHLNKDDRERG